MTFRFRTKCHVTAAIGSEWWMGFSVSLATTIGTDLGVEIRCISAGIPIVVKS